MTFKERVEKYLGEAEVKPGHKRLATRLSKDLNKNITPEQIEDYLDHKEKTKQFKRIKQEAKNANNPQNYEWGAKYKILKRHFSEGE